MVIGGRSLDMTTNFKLIIKIKKMKRNKTSWKRFIAALVVCAAFLVIPASVQAEKKQNNPEWLNKYGQDLIGYYPFNGNADDVSGNGNNATIFNANCSVEGVNKQGCDFEKYASLKYVLIPDSDKLDFDTGDFSISAWVNLRENGRFQWDTVVSHYASSKGWIFEIFGDKPFCHNCLSFQSAGPSDGPNGYAQYLARSENDAVTLNEWNHVVMTFENETVNFYVNGIFKGQTAGIKNPIKYDGAGFYVSGLGYNGRMDELMFFDKALSQKDVKKIYKKTIDGKGHEEDEDDCKGNYSWLDKFKNSLVSYYPFQGDASDISPNALNGYDNGADYVDDGLCGQAVSFPDSTDNVAIEYNPSFRLTRDDFTIATWVNPNSLKEYNAILDQGGLSNVYTGPSLYIKGNGEIKFSFEGSSDVDSSPNQVVSSKLAELKKWQHLAVTREGNILKIYVDGKLKGENTDLSPIANYASYLIMVGNYFRLDYEEYPGYTFDGKIDELSFFNKALSEKEILQVMKNSSK